MRTKQGLRLIGAFCVFEWSVERLERGRTQVNP